MIEITFDVNEDEQMKKLGSGVFLYLFHKTKRGLNPIFYRVNVLPLDLIDNLDNNDSVLYYLKSLLPVDYCERNNVKMIMILIKTEYDSYFFIKETYIL